VPNWKKKTYTQVSAATFTAGAVKLVATCITACIYYTSLLMGPAIDRSRDRAHCKIWPEWSIAIGHHDFSSTKW
jgi:hypothetical protein